MELVRSADHFGRIVLVNGHGGNASAVDAAVRLLRGEGRPVGAWWPSLAGSDAHAGRTETSLMLAIAPHLVRLDRAEPGCTEPLDAILPTLQARGVAAVAANGVLGDPSGASTDEGARLLAELVDSLAAAVAAVAAVPR